MRSVDKADCGSQSDHRSATDSYNHFELSVGPTISGANLMRFRTMEKLKKRGIQISRETEHFLTHPMDEYRDFQSTLLREHLEISL